MPPVINVEKCIGCGKCEICPGDLMEVNESTKKLLSYKQGLLGLHGLYQGLPHRSNRDKNTYQLGYYPAKLIPKMGNKQIEWTLIDINGKVERFIVKTHNK
ncbi:hypothetical protein N752_01245 [Desulforamulus aquiferis]|nr:hypothetical protein N752_01245 [Desulforamulus aquiferis]